MSIGRTAANQDSVVAGWRALRYFTNRSAAIRRFAEYVHDPPDGVLFFYGPGGNGKSLLLRALRRHYCRLLHPADWSHLRLLDNESLAAQLKAAEGAHDVPSVAIDFGARPRADYIPQDALLGLMELRRQLAAHRIRLPRFDFAVLRYLDKIGQLTRGRVERLFPAEEMDFVGALIDVLSQSTWGSVAKAFLGLLDVRVASVLRLALARRGVTEEGLAAIDAMDSPDELIDILPIFFAEDANAAIDAGIQSRIAFFFDTQDAFRVSGYIATPSISQHTREEWLRSLITRLELSRGFICVISGREPPQWPDAPTFPIPPSATELFKIGDFTATDAKSYLAAAGVTGEEIQRHILAATQTEDAHYHPFFLGLCADVALARGTQDDIPTDDLPEFGTTEPSQVLIDRLLRHVSLETASSVRALSACRSFDQDLYFHLGTHLRFAASLVAYQELTRMSFVKPAVTAEGEHYSIHELLRRLFLARGDELLLKSHRELERYYRERDEPTASDIAESVFHLNRVNWLESVQRWAALYEAALNRGHDELSHALEAIAGELHVGTQFWGARVVESLAYGSHGEERRHFLGLSRQTYAALAEEDPTDHVPRLRLGHVLVNIAAVLKNAGSFEAAANTAREAIGLVEEARRLGASRGETRYVQGLAWHELAEVAAELSDRVEAVRLFDLALAAYEDALAVERDLAPRFQHAVTLGQLAETLEKNGDLGGASQRYEDAIRDWDILLRSGLDNTTVRRNRADAARALSLVLARLDQLDDARAVYENAVAYRDDAVVRQDADAEAWLERARALLDQREAEVALHRDEAAESALHEALRAYERAMAASELPEPQGNIDLLYRFGRIMRQRGRPGEAHGYLLRAASIANERRHQQPDNLVAQTNCGIVLGELAEAELESGDVAAAVRRISEAVAVFDALLAQGIRSAKILNTRSALLVRLAEILGDASTARKHLENAVTGLHDALSRAPGNRTSLVQMLRARKLEAELTHDADRETAIAVHDQLAAFSESAFEQLKDIRFITAAAEARLELGRRRMSVDTTRAEADLAAAVAHSQRLLDFDSERWRALLLGGQALWAKARIAAYVKPDARFRDLFAAVEALDEVVRETESEEVIRQRDRVLIDFARAAAKAGRGAEALAAYQRIVIASREAIKSGRAEAFIWDNLCDALVQIGLQYESRDMPQQACEAYGASIREAATHSRLVPAEWSTDVERVLAQMTSAAGDAGTETAADELAAAAKSYEELAELCRHDVTADSALAGAHARAGELYHTHHRIAQALASFEQALKIYEAGATTKNDIAWTSVCIARCFVDAGDQRSAGAAFQAALAQAITATETELEDIEVLHTLGAAHFGVATATNNRPEASRHLSAAILRFRQVLTIDPTHLAAREDLDRAQALFATLK